MLLLRCRDGARAQKTTAFRKCGGAGACFISQKIDWRTMEMQVRQEHATVARSEQKLGLEAAEDAN